MAVAENIETASPFPAQLNPLKYQFRFDGPTYTDLVGESLNGVGGDGEPLDAHIAAVIETASAFAGEVEATAGNLDPLTDIEDALDTSAIDKLASTADDVVATGDGLMLDVLGLVPQAPPPACPEAGCIPPDGGGGGQGGGGGGGGTGGGGGGGGHDWAKFAGDFGCGPIDPFDPLEHNVCGPCGLDCPIVTQLFG
jgi:hypothetical protein